jgi:isoleucyl-tRNA synthetase
VLIPLWNCYSFFINYARLDKFDPQAAPVPLAQRPEIDRWILANLQALIETCNREFAAFNVGEACRATMQFIDDLSNWYVRRNRRRFWRSRTAGDADKLAAYQTMYEVLVDLTKLLAPCMPFLTERMYQNLVCSVAEDDADAPISVHLCSYPQVRPDRLDRELSLRMSAVQQAVSLGHKLRDEAKVRVRQPLAELRIGWAAETDAQERAVKKAAVESLADIIEEELNIKSVAAADSLEQMVRYSVQANMKLLGAKHGRLTQAVRKEIGEFGAEQIEALRRGVPQPIVVDGRNVQVQPEEVTIRAEVDPQWVFVEEGGLQVALSTQLTPELEREGMARDFVRHVQQLRKDHALEIEDRIAVEFACGDPGIVAALEQWRDYICSETLAERLQHSASAAGGDWRKVRVGSGSLQVRIEAIHSSK